jgi:trans-feruloyl-CoA hydratase/vanillin synthase
MNFPKPTIAMVNGWCFGGAFTPLVSCDLAIAAEDATFGISEINWGILPGGAVTRALASVMSLRDSMFYILTGTPFSGAQAAQMGIVNEAVPKAKLRSRTMEVARMLLEKNPHALRICKQAVRSVQGMPYEVAYDYLAAKGAQLEFQDDEGGRTQGLTQFLDEKSYRPGLGAMSRKKK